MTISPFAVVGVSLVILGMEWCFHFWRKLRWDPLGTLFDEVEAAVWTSQAGPNESRWALGSVTCAGMVMYGGACLLFVCWKSQNLETLSFGTIPAEHWAGFTGLVVPLMLGWALLAAWLCQEMRHPILPAVLADVLGCIFRAVVAIATILVLATAIPKFNGSVAWGIMGFGTSALVLASTVTGGLFRVSRHSPEDEDDPTVTTASDYPFSYLSLSAFFLLWSYVALVGTPSTRG